MKQPLVSRPAYGGPGTQVGVSQLPQGPPAGKGMPLDKDIPNAKTFAKPEDDIREPNVEDSSMYRQDDAGSLLKDQTVPDERDHTQFKPRYEPGGKDVTPKTKYPYRDGIPNTHNARTHMALTNMGPRDIALNLRRLTARLESAHPGTTHQTMDMLDVLRASTERSAGAMGVFVQDFQYGEKFLTDPEASAGSNPVKQAEFWGGMALSSIRACLKAIGRSWIPEMETSLGTLAKWMGGAYGQNSRKSASEAHLARRNQGWWERAFKQGKAAAEGNTEEPEAKIHAAADKLTQIVKKLITMAGRKPGAGDLMDLEEYAYELAFWMGVASQPNNWDVVHLAKIAPAPKTASVDIYKRTVKEMALALLDDRDNTRTVVIVADLLEALGYILKKLGHTEAYRYCKQAENAVISNAEGKIAL